MATKIRLARGGSKKRPFYRIVVANARAPRDGDFIEKIGTYNPLLSHNDASRVTIKLDRLSYWLSNGAQPSEKVISFIKKANVEMPSFLKKVSLKREQGNAIRITKKKEREAQEQEKSEAS